MSLQKWIVFGFIVSCFLCCNAYGVPFYRFRDSAFPSGDVALEKLLEKVVDKETQVQFKVSWDHHDFLISKNDLLFDLEVSEKIVTTNKTALMSDADFSSKKLLILPTGKTAKILRSTQLWMQVEVRTDEGTVKGWVHAQDIKTDETDFGFYRTLTEANLKEKPDSFAKTITTIPQLSALRVVEETSQWIEVQFSGHRGFVNKQYVLSKIDFAASVLDKSGEWFNVQKVKNGRVVVKTSDGETKSLPIVQLIKIRTDDSRAFVVRAQLGEHSPQVASRVAVIEKRGEIWYQSQIEGHNKVWWTEKKEKTKSVVLTDEELRKRKINSISLIDTGEILGLASANGIYKTDDGNHWTRIDSFQNMEYPVLAHPNGTLFVGPFRSDNKGEQFEPFIKWDELAALIKQQYNYDPKFFKMTKMEYVNASQIKLTIDVGLRKVKVLSAVNGLKMRLVR